MNYRVPTIVITSPVVLSSDLSACSSTAPVTLLPVDTITPGLTQSTGGVITAKPDPPSKPLVGQVAGFTLTQVQVHEGINSPLPDLESFYYGSDAQAATDPAGYEATGIEQLVVRSEGATENESVRVALETGTFSPRKHKEYMRRCAKITNHLGGADALTSIQTQQIPIVDGVINVVVTMAHRGAVDTEGDAGFSTYLIIDNVGDVNVTAQTYPPRKGASTGKEASLDTTVKIFDAQVKKLKDSSGSTSSSQTPSASSQDASDQDLSSELINSPVVGFPLALMESRSPLAVVSNPFYEASEYEINPDGCDRTGIDNLTTGAGGSLDPIHARVALGTDTSSPQKHRQYAQKCSTIIGTINGKLISESITLEDAPTIDGVIDVITASASSSIPNTDEIGPKSYLITDNVGDVNVAAHLFPLESGQDASYTDTTTPFKTQVEEFNS